MPSLEHHAHSRELSRRSLLQIGGMGLAGLSLNGVASPAQANAAGSHSGRAEVGHLSASMGWPQSSRYFRYEALGTRKYSGQISADPHQRPRLGRFRKARTHVAGDGQGLSHSQRSPRNEKPQLGRLLQPDRAAPPTDDQRLRDSRELYPAYGSVAADRFRPSQPGTPTFVSYPHVIADGSITPGQHASFLGQAHDPFPSSRQDPNDDDFRLPELSLPQSIEARARLENRREVVNLIDRSTRLLEISQSGARHEYPSSTCDDDADVADVSQRVRFGQGTHGHSRTLWPNDVRPGVYLARRLVEAGVRWITVYFAASIGGRRFSGGWDTHGFDNNPMYPILDDYLMPVADQTLPTLIEDLEDRGLLDDTLVFWAGEFGRSPSDQFVGRPRPLASVLHSPDGRGRRETWVCVVGRSDRIGAYRTTVPSNLKTCRPRSTTNWASTHVPRSATRWIDRSRSARVP